MPKKYKIKNLENSYSAGVKDLKIGLLVFCTLALKTILKLTSRKKDFDLFFGIVLAPYLWRRRDNSASDLASPRTGSTSKLAFDLLLD